MGGSEDNEISIKLTKFKKMSSTCELDKLGGHDDDEKEISDDCVPQDDLQEELVRKGASPDVVSLESSCGDEKDMDPSGEGDRSIQALDKKIGLMKLSGHPLEQSRLVRSWSDSRDNDSIYHCLYGSQTPPSPSRQCDKCSGPDTNLEGSSRKPTHLSASRRRYSVSTFPLNKSPAKVLPQDSSTPKANKGDVYQGSACPRSLRSLLDVPLNFHKTLFESSRTRRNSVAAVPDGPTVAASDVLSFGRRHSDPNTRDKCYGLCSCPLDLAAILKLSEEAFSLSPGKTLSILKSHLEQGNSLLQDSIEDQPGQQDSPPAERERSVRELARVLQLHLAQFTERLYLTKDRLEDTARCYEMLDKTYEWALEAMKAVSRVKGEGLTSPEQVGAAAKGLAQYLEEHPPVSDATFSTMTSLATRLNNQTLLQQCRMAQARCQETCALLQSRQVALLKARHQKEFDCQSFVDLNDILSSSSEDAPAFSWLTGSPFNNSGRRRRSISSLSSRPHEPLTRCCSFETDDDSVFNETQSVTGAKTPLEPKSSLGNIKEVRESSEDLQGSNDILEAIALNGLAHSAHPIPAIDGSSSSESSGNSSCSSSDRSGPTKVSWQFPSTDRSLNLLQDSGISLSPSSPKAVPPSSANSHLLIRGSQLNLSNTEDLSTDEVKKSKRLILILKELIQTERDYVNSLEYIIENYIPEIMSEDIPQVLRGQRNVIFGNIEKIFEFHSVYFLRALESCESKPFFVGSIFLKYESQFHLYALYNKNKPKSEALMGECGSVFFKKKQLQLLDRMDLASYLLKPVQRMGKYGLILKQLIKECTTSDHGYDDLLAAQEMVQFQLRHGNDLLAMDSLRECDVNLKEQGRLLRQGEFAVYEGGRARKTTRHVFLFEELILFSKARRDPDRRTLDIYQYKFSMKMTDIGLTQQVGNSPIKFEIWFRKRKPSDTYTLHAPNTETKETWTEEISKLLWQQALKNRSLRLHEMSSMGIGNKPCLDIRPSEDQISDRSVNINQLNKVPTLRKASTPCSEESVSLCSRRPYSIISVSSSASSSSSTNSSSHTPSLNPRFDSRASPKPLHRSVTRTSHCSAESGILADIYHVEADYSSCHRQIERSNSTITSVSIDSALSPSTLLPPKMPVSPRPSFLSQPEDDEPTDELLFEAPQMSPMKTLLSTEV